jgi:hypothetical protein
MGIFSDEDHLSRINLQASEDPIQPINPLGGLDFSTHKDERQI